MLARIVVDERERKSGIPDLLRQAGKIIDFAQLKVGDYVVSPETAIERKTMQDLLNSIYDGRLFVQCSQLNEYYAKPVLIVEGNIVDLTDIPKHQEIKRDLGKAEEEKEECDNVKREIGLHYKEQKGVQRQREEELEQEEIQGKEVPDINKINRTAQRRRTITFSEKIHLIYDALANVALDFRIPIIHTPSADYTSQLLVVMVNKSLQNGRATGPLLRRIKKDNPGYIQQLSILSSLPGIGDKLAVRMLNKFQTPSRALNASSAELARISGFGTERASRIRRILDSATCQSNDNTRHPDKEGKTIEKRLEVIQRTLLDELTEGNNKGIKHKE
jgi:DNA excision repair protein ERCC-4